MNSIFHQAEPGRKGFWFLPTWVSTSTALVFLFVVLMGASLLASFWVSKNLLQSALLVQEKEKIKAVGGVVRSLIGLQEERVDEISRLLSHSRTLSEFLSLPLPDRDKAVGEYLENALETSHLDVLQVTDEHEALIFDAEPPGRKGALSSVWGVAEALSGKGMLSSYVDGVSLVICGIQPLVVDGRVVGTLMAGVRFDERMIQRISKAVGVNLVIQSRQGQAVASGAEVLNRLDRDAVAEAFQQKIPIYRAEPGEQYTYVYLPLLIVDEAYVVLAQLDSRIAHELMRNNLFLFARNGLVILAVSVVLLIGVMRFFLRPLRRLREMANEVAGQFIEGDIKVEYRDEIASVANIIEILTSRLVDHNQDLVAANAQLMELDKLKNEFVSSVSHELRTPLTSIKGFTKLIQRDCHKVQAAMTEDWNLEKFREMTGRVRENLDVVAAETDRLTFMINDILDLVKIESESVEFKDEPVDPRFLARNAADLSMGLFNIRPELEFSVSYPDELPMVHVDHNRILQVLLNLISNADKFTVVGSVELVLSNVHGRVRFCVKDTGMGLSEQDTARVFDKFYQATLKDAMCNKPGGTGLGLSISNSILAHYGTRIHVESKLGEGSSFYFDLPEAGDDLFACSETDH